MGRSLAKLLVENDYIVGITGRRAGILEEIKNQEPKSYFVEPFDTTDILNIPDHLNKLVLALGGLDLLVISSGTGDLNETLNFEIEKRTIDTNVSGFTAIADWTFNYFQVQKQGHLVAISSLAGLRGNRQAPSYNATKAYQINYLEALRNKAYKTSYPICITDVRPGYVDTDMAKGDGLFWVQTVDKTVKQIFRAIQKKQKIVYVTKRWRLIAWIMISAPNWVACRI